MPHTVVKALSDLAEVTCITNFLSRYTFTQKLFMWEQELIELNERHGMDIYVPFKYVFETIHAMVQLQASRASQPRTPGPHHRDQGGHTEPLAGPFSTYAQL